MLRIKNMEPLIYPILTGQPSRSSLSTVPFSLESVTAMNTPVSSVLPKSSYLLASHISQLKGSPLNASDVPLPT